MENLKIRIARETDAEEILKIYEPYVLETAITFEYEVPSIEEFKNRIGDIKKKYPYIVAELDGVIVGYAYAGTFKSREAYNWTVETSVYVKKNLRRRKIGKTLYDTLESLLQQQGILIMNAYIAEPSREDKYLNSDSIFFHQKCGFRTVGRGKKCGYKFGIWYNLVWMEKLIGIRCDNQPDVKWWPEIEEKIKL